MEHPQIPTESEVAELVSKTGDIARGLAYERDLLRDRVKEAYRVIALYQRWEHATDIECDNPDSDIDSASRLVEASFAAHAFIEKLEA